MPGNFTGWREEESQSIVHQLSKEKEPQLAVISWVRDIAVRKDITSQGRKDHSAAHWCCEKHESKKQCRGVCWERKLVREQVQMQKT